MGRMFGLCFWVGLAVPSAWAGDVPDVLAPPPGPPLKDDAQITASPGSSAGADQVIDIVADAPQKDSAVAETALPSTDGEQASTAEIPRASTDAVQKESTAEMPRAADAAQKEPSPDTATAKTALSGERAEQTSSATGTAGGAAAPVDRGTQAPNAKREQLADHDANPLPAQLVAAEPAKSKKKTKGAHTAADDSKLVSSVVDAVVGALGDVLQRQGGDLVHTLMGDDGSEDLLAQDPLPDGAE